MQFSEISGFDEEKKILVNSVKKNHVAHAQLFFGMEGSPNLTLVLAFITASTVSCSYHAYIICSGFGWIGNDVR